MGSAGASELEKVVPVTSELPKVASEAAVVEMEVEVEERETATVLSREAVLRRRRRDAEQLGKYYRNEYWALMEEVRVRHRDYYWEYGKSPFEEENSGAGDGESPSVVDGAAVVEQFCGESEEKKARVGLGLGFCGEVDMKKGGRTRCMYAGCKSKAMPLSRFCHSHILSDNEQTLYKPCIYVIKNPHTGPIYCQKPVLRAATPLLCPMHFQKHQKNISQAFKKAGLNVSNTNRPAPKIHIIIAEYVNQIQEKRRRSSGESST